MEDCGTTSDYFPFRLSSISHPDSTVRHEAAERGDNGVNPTWTPVALTLEIFRERLANDRNNNPWDMKNNETI